MMETALTQEGWLTLIIGSMFSGKTEELMRRLRRYYIAKLRVLAVKPEQDKRFGLDSALGSHDRGTFDAETAENTGAIIPLARKHHPQVIGIDEGQFFSMGIVEVAYTLVEEGHRVLIAALNQDHTGKPFETISHLLGYADEIVKLNAVCVCCGREATKSLRTGDGNARIQVGAAGDYEARCRTCWDRGRRERTQENPKG